MTSPLYSSPQMPLNCLDSTEPLWCERTQDMSGYVLPGITSPPLDEHFQIDFDTAHSEQDFDLQNSENSSPGENLLRDQTKVLGEDNIVFDTSYYSELHTKMKTWLPKISTMELNEFASNNMSIESDSNPQAFLQKDDNRPSATDAKQRHLSSIFDCEEPLIAEDLDILSSFSNDSKVTFDKLKDGMDVAEEVEVTTEVLDESKSKMFLGSFFFDSSSPEYLVDTREEVMLPETKEISSPLGGSSLMETTFDFDSVFSEEDDLYTLDPEPQTQPQAPARLHPPLRLNIQAASQLLCGGLPDTPEVLKPVLKPETEFDLVNYLMTVGDSNNNNLPITPVSAKPRLQSRGKSHLSMADLRECHKYGRGKPSPLRSPSASPSPSSVPSCSSSRPARKSASKFKKLLEEGLLDSGSMSAEDEDTGRRSISSTSSRKRLNSDSDLSSVGAGENSSRYRERRDRNNLSSKRSRQKRKQQQEQKKVELKDLENQNKRLRRKADQLAAVLDKVHKAWKEYLEKMKKD